MRNGMSEGETILKARGAVECSMANGRYWPLVVVSSPA